MESSGPNTWYSWQKAWKEFSSDLNHSDSHNHLKFIVHVIKIQILKASSYDPLRFEIRKVKDWTCSSLTPSQHVVSLHSIGLFLFLEINSSTNTPPGQNCFLTSRSNRPGWPRILNDKMSFLSATLNININIWRVSFRCPLTYISVGFTVANPDTKTESRHYQRASSKFEIATALYSFCHLR